MTLPAHQRHDSPDLQPDGASAATVLSIIALDMPIALIGMSALSMERHKTGVVKPKDAGVYRFEGEEFA
jgi:hypothetical protein